MKGQDKSVDVFEYKGCLCKCSQTSASTVQNILHKKGTGYILCELKYEHRYNYNTIMRNTNRKGI